MAETRCPTPVLGWKPGAPPLVLASGSAARAGILAAAGLPFTQDSANVDEDEVKAALRGEGASADAVATALAELKAVHVSRRHPGALVVGADQMLDCGGRWFDKPADRDAARAQLLALRGRTHDLVTAAVVLRDGTRLWQHVERASLTMRPVSDAFVESYLAALGDDAMRSVGAYQLEGLGAQLFAQVEGDFFTILGLPLLPLLDFLRGHGTLLT